MDMEWNSKWDWENFVNFGPKAIDSPKKLQLADWMVVEDGEFHGSHNLSGGSSAKSSISASTDSSTKEGVQTPSFRFEGTSGNLSKKVEVSGTSNASVGSTEALLGLKLGKRTYFENNNGGSVKSSTSLSAMPTPATNTLLKKTKSSAINTPVLCQVEGCNIDLSKAKEYHRKHRVCDTHSKWPTVTVAGRERRFCQQCSRFHSLSEFDEKKRSCRRRLSDHNARRRKPQQETMQFDSTRLSTPFYGNQQMSFLFNNSALVHSKTLGTCTWDNSKFTLSKGYSWKSNGDGGTDKQLHMLGIKNPQSITMQNAANGLPVSKNSTSLVSDPGSKGSMISPLDAAPEYRRALSLLSNNSWDSCEPESSPLHHHMQENNSTIMQPMIHAIPEGVPLSSSEFWLSGHHSTQSLPTNSNFQEIQLFKTPYDADFYSNMLN